MSSMAPVQQPAAQTRQGGWQPRNFDEIQKDLSGLEQGKDYQIQSGDTLSSIAQALKAQHNLKQGIPEIVEELRKTNGIQDANKIQAGKPLSVEAALRNLKAAEEGQQPQEGQPQTGDPQSGQPAEGAQPQGQQQRTPTVNREQLMNYVQALQQMGFSNEEIMQMLQRQGIIVGGQPQAGSPQATPQPEASPVQPGRQNQPIMV